MTSVMDRADKIAEYIGECKKMGLEVLPPDVNESLARFTVVEAGGEDAIRFGMNAIKNLGRPTVAAIVAERENDGPYRSLTEFINRLQSVDLGKSADLNKRGLESLIKAGAFASFGGTRSQYISVYERFLAGSQSSRKNNMAGQMSLLDMDLDEDSGDMFQDELPQIAEFPMKKLLEDEKEVLGIYVSGHPLMDYESLLKGRVNATSTDFIQSEDEEMTGQAGGSLADNQIVTVGGIVSKKNIVYTRRENKPMCFVTIEDLQGFLEIVVFPNLYQTHGGRLVEGAAVLVEGKVNIKEEAASVVISEKIQFLDKDSEAADTTLWLKVPKEKQVPLEDVMTLLSRYGGHTPVVVYDEASGERRRVSERYWVNSRNGDLLDRLRDLLGADCVVLKS